MTPKELNNHKKYPKALANWPSYKPLKKGKLPRPFAKIGGGLLQCSGLLRVSDIHRLVFIVKTGEVFTDCHFYAHLLYETDRGDLFPLFEFHWHPNHKGFHCKTPCRASIDYTNRMLPGARELAMTTKMWDPRKARDLTNLMTVVCQTCGVETPQEAAEEADQQMDLWR